MNVSRLHGCIHGLLRVVRLNINVIAYFVVKSVYQEMVSTQTDGSVFVSVWQRIVLTKMAIHSRQWKIWSLTLQNSVTMMLQEGSNCTSHLFRIYHLLSARTMYDAISLMKIPKYADQPTGVTDDHAMKQVLNLMTKDQSKIWNSVELHSCYTDFGGNLSRDMFAKLTDCMKKDVIIVWVDGCATMVGFREAVASILKVTKVTDVDESSADSVVRQIKHEAQSIKYNSANYDHSEFTQENTVKSTSSTLLKLVSDLVSDGEVTKKSLSLSQSIQSHNTGTWNQTILGIAIKLHHRHGSSELLKLLHKHGFTASYDEVLRFRKSAARYIGDNISLLHQFMGLSRTVGIIFAWFDNLDLQVFTPNGRRTTHVVTHEFQQPHPAGILEYGCAQPGKSSLIIPRLSKKTAQSSSCSNHSGSIPLLHYTGPNKVNPPAMPCSQGVPYLDVCARNASLSASQE